MNPSLYFTSLLHYNPYFGPNSLFFICLRIWNNFSPPRWWPLLYIIHSFLNRIVEIICYSTTNQISLHFPVEMFNLKCFHSLVIWYYLCFTFDFTSELLISFLMVHCTRKMKIQGKVCASWKSWYPQASFIYILFCDCMSILGTTQTHTLQNKFYWTKVCH